MKNYCPIKRLSTFLCKEYSSVWNELIENEFIQSSLHEIRQTLRYCEKNPRCKPEEMFKDVFDEDLKNQPLELQIEKFSCSLK